MRGCIRIFVAAMLFSGSLMAADFPKIDGWKPVSEVKAYQPENLWEYIDGAAELFLSYGFREMVCCDLSAKDRVVTVHIYDMGTRLNAFGIYRTERPDGIERLPVGAEGTVLPPYQCLLLKDRFYVKVDAYEGEISETIGKALLAAVAKALKGENTFPEEFKQLPKEGLIAGSERYVRENYLGLADLNRCVYAEYKGEKGKTYQVFTMLPGERESITTQWEKLSAKWKARDHKGTPVLYRTIPYKGFVGIVLVKGKIFGVSDAEDEVEMLHRIEILLE
ncbi:MAG: DUF6599 family protein [bacterium]